MTPTRSTLDMLDIPLPGGRTLRLALHRGPDGDAELLIAAGYPDRIGWPRVVLQGFS